MSSTLVCNNCGADNLAGAVYCRSCGDSLQSLKPTLYHSTTGRLLASVVLKQRYRIVAPIGQGGMGAVYKAEDIELGNRQVALKEMSQSGLSSQEQKEAAEAFKQEAIILARLQHPNLPSIFDHFEENRRWYLVMSFIEGETLANYLEKVQGGKLALDEVRAIGMKLCTVLGYLHNQQPAIIFRDLKPANIMRTTDGHVYLIDFGIARHFKPGQAKDTANYGSMGYAPPEQYGRAQTTPRSDIYSLGVVLYQLLSGYDPSASPFHLPALQSQVTTIPVELATLVSDMIEMDESKRPPSMQVVSQRLQGMLTFPMNLTGQSSQMMPHSPSGIMQPSSGAAQPSSGAIANVNIQPSAGTVLPSSWTTQPPAGTVLPPKVTSQPLSGTVLPPNWASQPPSGTIQSPITAPQPPRVTQTEPPRPKVTLPRLRTPLQDSARRKVEEKAEKRKEMGRVGSFFDSVFNAPRLLEEEATRSFQDARRSEAQGNLADSILTLQNIRTRRSAFRTEEVRTQLIEVLWKYADETRRTGNWGEEIVAYGELMTLDLSDQKHNQAVRLLAIAKKNESYARVYEEAVHLIQAGDVSIAKQRLLDIWWNTHYGDPANLAAEVGIDLRKIENELAKREKKEERERFISAPVPNGLGTNALFIWFTECSLLLGAGSLIGLLTQSALWAGITCIAMLLLCLTSRPYRVVQALVTTGVFLVSTAIACGTGWLIGYVALPSQANSGSGAGISVAIGLSGGVLLLIGFICAMTLYSRFRQYIAESKRRIRE